MWFYYFCPANSQRAQPSRISLKWRPSVFFQLIFHAPPARHAVCSASNQIRIQIQIQYQIRIRVVAIRAQWMLLDFLNTFADYFSELNQYTRSELVMWWLRISCLSYINSANRDNRDDLPDHAHPDAALPPRSALFCWRLQSVYLTQPLPFFT